MLLREGSLILLLCNLYNNDVFPRINANQLFYQVDQLFAIPHGLDLKEQH